LNTNRVATALLVDDDPTSQQSNQERLEHDGFSVFVARDGIEGLARAKQIMPDAIFVHLAKGAGNIPFIQDLRADDSCRHIRVVVLTSQARVDPAKKPLRTVPRDGW